MPHNFLERVNKICPSVYNFFKNKPLMFSLIIFEFFLFLKVHSNFEIKSFIILLCAFVLIIYNVLYYKLNIERSIKSFIAFFLNCCIALIYFIGLYYLLTGLNEPFYIEDLSIFSRYRYLIFVILGFFCAIIWLYLHYAPISSQKLRSTISFISKPILFEEFLKLFEIWEDTFFGPLFEKIINEATSNFKKRFSFFSIHFLFSYIIPIIISGFFVNFAFFHGDLRYVFYLLPLSFISWLYKHLFFYFIRFLDQNCIALSEYLIIKPLKEPSLIENKFVGFNVADISIKLSDKAFNDFGPECDYTLLLNLFQNDFQRLNEFQRHIHFYYTKVSKLSYFIFFIRYLVWVKISSAFFFETDVCWANPSNLFKICPPFTVIVRPYVTKAYYVKPKDRKALETITNGAYKSNHPITTDTDKVDASGKIPFYNQLTHKKGSANNPSKPLSSVVDVEGNPIPHNAVYSDPALGLILVPITILDKEIKGSESFYERQDVLDNDKLNTPFPYKP